MFHLVATKTVLPTLKSAREFNSTARPPQIIASDEIDADAMPTFSTDDTAMVHFPRTM